MPTDPRVSLVYHSQHPPMVTTGEDLIQQIDFRDGHPSPSIASWQAYGALHSGEVTSQPLHPAPYSPFPKLTSVAVVFFPNRNLHLPDATNGVGCGRTAALRYNHRQTAPLCHAAPIEDKCQQDLRGLHRRVNL